ncbi:MAG: prephenate dehydrogenase [Candidatus Auribacterota bacterium]|jgi:prephenate dehydrogenase|nr:prephenate dehydrogenase [Candidatus Auribacterota bacterium]
MTYPEFKNIAIIGMGLMGGSLGKALCQQFSGVTVTGIVRRENAVDEVISNNAAHYCTTDLCEGLKHADLVVLAIPVETICGFAPKIAPLLADGCVVTDMGSTKEKIVSAMNDALENTAYFVGSHPMCGSEMASIGNASAELYRNALCIITPDDRTNTSSAQKVERFWKSIGCRTTLMPPAGHDRLVAAISHIPHLIAAGLVNTAKQVTSDSCTAFELASSGFIDTTRVASGSPEMWLDICVSNWRHIVEVLKKFEDVICALRHNIEKQDVPEILSFLQTAKTARDSVITAKKGIEK